VLYSDLGLLLVRHVSDALAVGCLVDQLVLDQLAVGAVLALQRAVALDDAAADDREKEAKDYERNQQRNADLGDEDQLVQDLRDLLVRHDGISGHERQWHDPALL